MQLYEYTNCNNFSLQTLLDHRKIETTQGMFEAIVDQVRFSFNGGAVRPAISIFRQRCKGKKDMRVWNRSLFMYAGYSFETSHGLDGLMQEPKQKKIGDQLNVEFTRVVGGNAN